MTMLRTVVEKQISPCYRNIDIECDGLSLIFGEGIWIANNFGKSEKREDFRSRTNPFNKQDRNAIAGIRHRS